MHILRLTKSPVAHSELQGVHLLRHFGVAHRMEGSDISAWCTEMLAGSDLTSAQAAAGDAQAQDTPVPKSSPVVRVPLSNTLEAFVFPKVPSLDSHTVGNLKLHHRLLAWQVLLRLWNRPRLWESQ